MALVNHAKKEINAKIVYIGPELAGKATHLNYIFKRMKAEFRGQLKFVDIQSERMLFFDFMQEGRGGVDGYNIRFHLYTITGATTANTPWKMVLKGVDGIAFVADSSPERMSANLESLQNLVSCLVAHGTELKDLPCVVFCNKRDKADAMSLEEMQRSFGLGSVLFAPSVAAKGEGVLEGLFSLIKMVQKNLREAGLEQGKETVPESQPIVPELHAPAEPEVLSSDIEEPAESPVGWSVAEAPAFEAPEPFAAVEPFETAETSYTLQQESEPDLSFKSAGPSVQIVGKPVAADDGSLRIPLKITCCGHETSIALRLNVALEELPE